MEFTIKIFIAVGINCSKIFMAHFIAVNFYKIKLSRKMHYYYELLPAMIAGDEKQRERI